MALEHQGSRGLLKTLIFLSDTHWMPCWQPEVHYFCSVAVLHCNRVSALKGYKAEQYQPKETSAGVQLRGCWTGSTWTCFCKASGKQAASSKQHAPGYSWQFQILLVFYPHQYAGHQNHQRKEGWQRKPIFPASKTFIQINISTFFKQKERNGVW